MSRVNEILDDLNDNEVFGMTRIWYYPIGTKSVEVYVHTDDPGKVPHFHVRKKGNGRFEWGVCIRYDSCDYFSHERYRGKLPSKKNVKELDSMLRTIDIRDRGRRTFWEKCVDGWNDNNSDIELDLDIEQPDYSELSIGR